MIKQAGKFSPVFDLQDSQTASILGVGPNLAGFAPATGFGTGTGVDFQQLQKFVKSFPKDQRETAMQYGIIAPLIQASMRQLDPDYQEEMLKRQDKYDTKRGFKSLMFNQLGSGLNSLAKGIGMSMNPYGTPEAARYVADMAAQRGAAQAAGYSAVRTPMNLPIVQQASAPSYF